MTITRRLRLRPRHVPAPTGSDGVEMEKRTSYLELFFDLVFVFAITQLAGLLHDNHTPAGWVHAALMAWLLWWAWSQYTWAGNAIDLDRRSVRAAILAVAGLTLLAAIAIPDAFAPNGLWFAVPYASIRLAGLALYWTGLAHDPTHRMALRTYVPIAMIGPILVLIGGAAPPETRPWIWGVAVVVDIISVLAAGKSEFRVAAGHFAERHALIIIIAIGESVIAIGATATSLEPTAALIGTVVFGFVLAAVLWWDYFDWIHEAAEARLASEPDHRRRSNLARDLFTFGHLPLVAGTVVFAVAIEEAVAHPTDPLDSFGRTALATGLALFLLGFAAGNARATGTILVERLLAAVVTTATILTIGSTISALALLAVLACVLTAAVAIETHRRRAATKSPSS